MKNLINQQNISDCCFCKEFKEKEMPGEFIEHSHIQNRIIQETKSFIVIPSVSPITQGHIMILPKYHIKSMAQINPENIGELISIFSNVSNKLKNKLGDYIFFEHGIGKSKQGGCGVDHAHLHLLPVQEKYFNSLIENITKDFQLVKEIDLSHFIINVAHHDSYLMMGNSSSSDVLYSINNNIPSQYLRQKIALITNSNPSDWKQLFGWSDFEKTISSFRTI